MKKHTLFIIMVITVALLIGIWREDHSIAKSSTLPATPVPLSVGTLLPHYKKIPPFTLTAMTGGPFTHQSLKNHWSFLFFGYTACPDICPATLKILQQVAKHLHYHSQVQYIFITINSEYDTVEQLKNYFSQDTFKETPFIGVTGEREKIMKLLHHVGGYVAPSNGSVASIEHSGTLFLIDPEGKLSAIFNSPQKPYSIASDFKKIVHRFSQQT